MDAEQSANLWISILYRYRKMFMSKRLEDCGVAGGCPFLILDLYENDGANQEQLAAALKTDKATVARAVQKLEAEGFIRREEDPGDKRAYRVFLTAKGKAAIPSFKSAFAEWNRTLEDGIPEEALAVFRQTLEKMSRNACSAVKAAP
jgi:Transcriptional regulators